MTHHLLNNSAEKQRYFQLENKIEQQQQLFHEILQVLSQHFVCSFLGVVLVQWPSQDFKVHLDIDYIWVFLSSYVSRGIGGPKKPNLLFPSVGQIFLWCVE